ncbi:hypothetical protein COO60DRAFT_774578 [Scenedesmus sp. NREL 46B-D3]|nr:hypothetical protein COO60DRAFT_774578 [Scenedesmus sp. NREL 46B-D3]
MVAAATAEGCDAVEGIASMAAALKYAQPAQVILTSAKSNMLRLEDKAGALEGEALRQQLNEDREALEREKAAFAVERARLMKGQQPQQQQQQQQQQQRRKPTLGQPFARPKCKLQGVNGSWAPHKCTATYLQQMLGRETSAQVVVVLQVGCHAGTQSSSNALAVRHTCRRFGCRGGWVKLQMGVH